MSTIRRQPTLAGQLRFALTGALGALGEAIGAEDTYRLIFDSLDEGVVLQDGAGRILAQNASAQRILGLSDDDASTLQAVREDGTRLPAPEQPAAVALSTGEVQRGVRMGLRRRRRTIWLSVNAVPLSDDDAVVWTFSDVSAQVAAEAELRHLALHDALTALPTRRLLTDRLEQALARTARTGKQVGLLFCDLDGFKQINDRAGHAAGDEVLVAVAGLLQFAVRPGDTVGRLGGDEFAVLCEDVSPIELERIVERVATRCAFRHEHGGVELSIGAALGDHATTAAALLAEADGAMYVAKRRNARRVGQR